MLSGKAANVVAGLALSSDNYDNAIAMLQSRFGCKDLVINAHMNKLLNLNPIRKANDISAFRNLYDEIEVQVRSLDAVGVVSDSYGSLLCPILMKMIPEEITLEFTRRMADGSVLKVKELMEYVKREVESRERTSDLIQKREAPTTATVPQYREKAWERRSSRRAPNSASTAAFHTANTDDAQCLFCNRNDHRSKDCAQFTVEIR